MTDPAQFGPNAQAKLNQAAGPRSADVGPANNSNLPLDATGPEETEWTARPNWKHYCGPLAMWVFLSLAVFVLVAILWPDSWTLAILLPFLVGLFFGTKIAITVLSTRYQLTTQRLFIERGLISTTKDQCELIRVDDVRVQRSLIDRVFDLGTVEVLTSDATDRSIDINGITDPDKVAELIRSHTRTARKKSLFIEPL